MSLDSSLLARFWNRGVSPEEIADAQHITAMRNDVRYFGYRHPLVEWTMCDDWTNAAPFRHVTGDARGAVTGRAANVAADTVKGEIVCLI